MGRNKKRGRRKANRIGVFRPWLGMIAISLVFGAGLFSMALVVERVAGSPSFRVEKIDWHGLGHLDEKEMTARFQSVLGKNIFMIDILEIHRRLMTEKWIKSATVKKDFPNRLSIFVVERKPASVEYRLDDEGKRWVSHRVAPVLIDREGVILQKGGSLPSGLARLIHVNATAYDKALALWARLDAYPGAFIDLKDPQDLLVYLSDEKKGTRLGLVHLGETDYAERWARFLAIAGHLQNRFKAGGPAPWEVDLRFAGQVIVKNGLGKLKTVSGSSPDSTYF